MAINYPPPPLDHTEALKVVDTIQHRTSLRLIIPATEYNFDILLSFVDATKGRDVIITEADGLKEEEIKKLKLRNPRTILVKSLQEIKDALKNDSIIMNIFRQTDLKNPIESVLLDTKLITEAIKQIPEILSSPERSYDYKTGEEFHIKFSRNLTPKKFMNSDQYIIFYNGSEFKPKYA